LVSNASLELPGEKCHSRCSRLADEGSTIDFDDVE
jgi:hypothetical protein